MAIYVTSHSIVFRKNTEKYSKNIQGFIANAPVPLGMYIRDIYHQLGAHDIQDGVRQEFVAFGAVSKQNFYIFETVVTFVPELSSLD